MCWLMNINKRAWFALLTVLTLFSRVSFAQSTNEPPHPILTISGSGSGASTILSTWTETQYTNDFIPQQGPRNDADGFAPAVVSGDTGWSWSPSTPNQITSTPSGTIFPNSNYPVHTTPIGVISGKTIQAPYYLKAGSSSSKSLVNAVIDLHKRDHLRGDLDTLAPAYVNSGSSPTTRNDAYARRIAIALRSWADYFPDYFITPGWNTPDFLSVTTNYILTSDLQRASDHNGLAHEWQDDELKAFDAIYDSVALTNLSVQLGYDVRAYIASNLFFFEGDFIVNHVPVDVAILSNLSGPFEVLPEVARLLNRPDYIIWEDQYLDATVRQKIRRDGTLEEGMGYSIGYLQANTGASQNTHNYFLTRPATNSLLLAISNRTSSYIATLNYGQSQWNSASLPTGQLPSFGDTPFNNYFSSHSAGNSSLLPAYGHVAIGAGSGNQAVQVNQNFPGNNNHMRCDTTAFVLWAFNNEILGNIRYYHCAGRQFDEQMLAHNSVTIDRANETPYPDADTYGNGDLTLYEPGNNGLAMTEIDGQRGYSGKASRYQRLLFLNSADLNRPYLVDVFRVTGGTNHDYVLHGAIRWDQTWECSFPLVTNPAPYPMLEGETWVEPTDQYQSFPYYGFWRQVSSNQAPGNFQITYRDTNRTTARDLRLWMTDDGTAKVYLGMTPNPGRDNTVPANFYVYWRPSAIIRKRITSGTLQDLFVSVVEPMNAGTSTIQSMDRLPVTGSNLDSCALRITFTDGRVDTYLVNLHNNQVNGATSGSNTVSTADGQYVLTGRVGAHMSFPGTGGSRVWTMNATDFQFAGRRFTTPGTYYSGLVSGATRKLDGATNDAFTTATSLPTGTALRNKYLSLTHGTLSGTSVSGVSEMFKIDQIISSNGQYYVCFTNDHMLEITNSTTTVEQVAPLRTFTGSNSFEITMSSFAADISTISDVTIPPNGSSGPLSFSFGNLGGTSGASLQISASSSNAALVPNGNIVIGGTGTNRTITVTPISGVTGTSLITVSVTDGVSTNSFSFNVTVSNFGMTANPTSLSVLAGSGTNYNITAAGTNGFNGLVTFSISGLPMGVGASFNPPTITGSGSTTLNVTTSSNTPPGNYTLNLSATSGSLSATTSVALVVTNIVAAPGTLVWNGSGGNINWSGVPNWTNITAGGYGPPGPSNDLSFLDSGTVSTTNTVNNVMDGDTTIKSLTYGNSNNFHTTQLATGHSLNIFGTSGLLVGTETDNGTAQTVKATITGAGSSLNLNGGNITVRQATDGSSGGTQRATLDLSGVDSLSASMGRIVIGSEGGHARPTGTVYLPKTNSITLTGSAPTIAIGGTGGASGNSGGISQLYLGRSNQIFTDTITVGRGKQSTSGGQASTIAFNPALTNANPATDPSAYFRASNGSGRIANWTLADAGSGGGTVNTAGASDFTGGTVDAMVDVMTLAKSSTGSGVGNPTATFTMAAGIMDINTLQIGYQGASGTNFSTATVNVNGGTLLVNTNLQLAVTTGGGGAPLTVGNLNINGGTVQATNVINAGGVANINLNSGTLDLNPAWAIAPGRILNASTLNIGANGQSAPATLNNAANISTTNSITIASNGVLSGNTSITSQKLIVNGTISPGGTSVGVLSNTGPITFGPGGHYLWAIQDALGSPGISWDFLQTGGGFDVQATSVNPFVIQLQSLEDPVQGLPHFDNTMSFSWPIATGVGNVTNFASSKFSVLDGGVPDDLAGGYFFVSAGGNSLNLIFTNNHPPVASDASYYYASGTVLKIPIAALALHWSDPDGDPVVFSSVQPSSAQGANNVSADATYIYYSNPVALADTITYSNADVRANPPAIYRSGDTQLTGTGLIQILPLPSISSVAISGAALNLAGSNGFPNTPCSLLTSTNVNLPVPNWTVVQTNTFDANGRFNFTVPVDTSGPSHFFLLKLN